MCQLLQELLSLCKPVHCTAWCILSALNAWVALNLERLWRGENPWITESMPIHPRLDWPKIIFTNSFWMSQVASSCLYCAAVCVCGNTFRGRAAAHNKLIVGREDAHNELPIIRFWRRSAKLYIYLFDPQKELVTLDNDNGVNFLNFSLSNASLPELSNILHGAKPSNQILPEEKGVNCNNFCT